MYRNQQREMTPIKYLYMADYELRAENDLSNVFTKALKTDDVGAPSIGSNAGVSIETCANILDDDRDR